MTEEDKEKDKIEQAISDVYKLVAKLEKFHREAKNLSLAAHRISGEADEIGSIALHLRGILNTFEKPDDPEEWEEWEA